MNISVVDKLPTPDITVAKTPAPLPSISVNKTPAPQPKITVQKTAPPTPDIKVGPAAPTPNVLPPKSPAVIANAIGAARSRPGVKDEQILAKIVEQNPSKADTVKVALQKGASPTQILDEIVRQNLPSEPVKQEKGDNFLTSILKDIATPFARAGASVFNVGAGIVKAAQGDIAGANEQLDKTRNIAGIEAKPLTTPLEGFGAGAEIGSWFVGGSGAVGAGEDILKGVFKQTIKTAAKEGLVIGALGGGGRALENDKSFVGVVADTAIGGLLGGVGGAVLSSLGSVVKVAYNKVAEAVNPVLKIRNLFRTFTDAVDTGVSKAIRPSTAGKTSAATVDLAKDSARQAIATILDNKAALKLTDESGTAVSRLPKSLDEFLDVIGQTKKTIFQKYDFLQKAAGKAGATIDLAPVADELGRIANDPRVKDVAPEAARYALEKAASMRERGSYGTQTAQDVIEGLNAKLKAFYRNPTANDATNAYVDSLIANRLRDSLDGVISNTTTPGYQVLKKQYGSLSDLEKAVAKRAVVAARRAPKGVFDITDVFSGSDVVQAVLTGQPASLVTGAAKKGIAEYLKFLNNPDRLIANMFTDADKAYTGLLEHGQTVLKKPEFNPMKSLPAPVAGSVKSKVNTAISLPAKTQSTIDAEERAALKRVGGKGSHRYIRRP